MPFKLRFLCRSQESIMLPRFTGHVVRAVLLAIVGSIDRSAAERLHGAGDPKPYSVTPMRFKASGRTDRGFVLAPSSPCSFSIRFLDDSYSQYLVKYLVEHSDIEVCGGTLRIESVQVSLKSYEELYSKALEVEAFTLRFLTPTYFSKWGVEFHEAFPHPVAVFMNLLNLWNEFSPIKFDKKTFRDWVEKSIAVSGYKLQKPLKTIDIGRGRAISGFSGWCAYRFFPHKEFNEALNKNHLKLLYTLCRFGEFSNVGGNRTGGFGVIKFIPKLAE